MGKPKLRDVISAEEMTQMYCDEKMSQKDIADKYGYSKKAVANLMSFYGIETRDRDKARLAKVATAQHRLSKEQLYSDYITNKMSTSEIALKYGMLEPTIVKLRKAYGIKSRTRTQSNLLRHEKTPKVNEDFFRKESSDFFYVLGLIASDGYISADNKIGLCLKDKDVIVHVAQLIGYKNTISEVEGKGPNDSKTFSIGFGNPRVCDILRTYSITEKKSLTLQFPNIPERYVRDFIRGVFDGDGTVSYKEVYGARGKLLLKAKVGIVSASPDFISAIKDTIDKAISKEVKITIDKRGNRIYMYYFSDRKCIDKFSRWLYGEDFEQFGMGRKKRKLIYISEFITKASA